MNTPGPIEVLHCGRFLEMVRRDSWEFVRRVGISGIVGIVAVTDDDELVLVEQYRPPVGATVIELPAGLVGDQADCRDEPLADAAMRELLEETGFQAREMTELLEGTPSAGTTGERMTIFRATGLQRAHAGGGDDSEDIAVHVVPMKTLPAWLQEQTARGALIDLKVYLTMGVGV